MTRVSERRMAGVLHLSDETDVNSLHEIAEAAGTNGLELPAVEQNQASGEEVEQADRGYSGARPGQGGLTLKNREKNQLIRWRVLGDEIGALLERDEAGTALRVLVGKA